MPSSGHADRVAVSSPTLNFAARPKLITRWTQRRSEDANARLPELSTDFVDKGIFTALRQTAAHAAAVALPTTALHDSPHSLSQQSTKDSVRSTSMLSQLRLDDGEEDTMAGAERGFE